MMITLLVHTDEFKRNPLGDLMESSIHRRGIGIGEVIVVLAIVAVVGLLLITAMPRQREAARMAGCRLNLREIGVALVLTDKVEGRIPSIPSLGPEEPPPMSGPLALMLQSLGIPSFAGLTNPDQLPADRPGAPTGPIRIPGFTCPSDGAGGLQAPAKVSYRGTAGGSVEGGGGVFAPGRGPLTLADVEAADGQQFTAAFSERLVGTGRDVTDSRNYALVPGPIEESGTVDPPSGAWRGDAGSSWTVANWASTLYTHALPPGGAPSIIAEDGRTASMGASSGHVEGVNVLRCDLSVTTVTTRVDLKVWKALAELGEPEIAPEVAGDGQVASQEVSRP